MWLKMEEAMNTQKNKHLTLEDRREIEDSLIHNLSFKKIAMNIGKDPTTVSKEIKKHIQILSARNPEAEFCNKLLKAPFVCNGCKLRNGCTKEKHYYRADKANSEYRTDLVESRTGIALNKESFYRADEILYNSVVRNGQHIYHATQSHNLGMSVSSVYRNISKGYLSISKLDLPRAVKFKPRKKEHSEYVPKAVKKGRTYDDFLLYTSENEIESWVEMDTVIGRIGGKTIMTFDFTDCNFMFGLLLENKTAAAASEAIISLKKFLLEKSIRFGEFIPLLLTDNGIEFSDIFSFMCDPDGVMETNLFFCDPYRSSEKPYVEKNHTIFRDICPKGTSFDSFTQNDVNLIFSHVNSVKRKKLHKKSPYEMFSFTYGTEIASALGIQPIPEEEVCQSPKLLKQLSK